MSTVQSLHIAAHYLRARWRWQHLRGARLHRFQEERARRIVAYAHDHSRFYHDLWKGFDIRAWRALPTVDKKSMMADFTRFNTRGIDGEAAMAFALDAEQTRKFAPAMEGLTIGLSSGTSGHRGLFLVSPQEQTAWAGVILARALHEVRLGGVRVAFFLRSFSNLYARTNSRLVELHYFDLMMRLDDAVAALNRLRPDIVVGPPSLLVLLATAQRSGHLAIRPLRLISVAEVLEPQDDERLRAVFQAPVHQIYQCTEGLLAISCPHGSLHVQEDLVALQYEHLDEPSSDDAGPARVTPIVTDLWRRTQPIIRYRLNDVLRLSTTRCACGSEFQVIAAIEGRCDDICYFLVDGGGRRPFFPDTLRRGVLLASPQIEEYQIVQERDDHLRVHLTVSPSAEFDVVAASVTSSLRDTIAGYGCRSPRIAVERGLQPTTPDAKRRRVQRLGGA